MDEVLLGNCYPTMEAPAIGRVAAPRCRPAGHCDGLQIDRRAGSGLQAVIYAAMQVQPTREWRFGPADFERLNVNGSGISLGHPVGATGGRILATLSREMLRRDVRYGLETMCIGGGQWLAAIFERA